MTNKEKPKYGFVAVKYFAIMGALGIAGLILVLGGMLFPPPISWILFGVGIPIAFIGLYIGVAYVFLYHLVFKVKTDGDRWNRFVAVSGLKGREEVIDVGCGTGRVSISIAKMLTTGHVTGIDIFKGVSGDSPTIAMENAQIEGVADKVEFRYGNALELPFNDETFDLVTMGSVLHEVHKKEKKIQALQEAYRILKPGGKLIAVENLRNHKLFLWLLIFAFVFQTKEYWEQLFALSKFQKLDMKIIRGPIDIGIMMAKKH